MISLQLLHSHEMNRSVIVAEVVGHCNYLFLYCLFVSPLLNYYKALSRMLLSCSELGLFTALCSLKGSLHGNSILSCIDYSFDTSYGITVALADALSPEGIILSLRKHTASVKSHKRKHSGIPSAGDKSRLSRRLRSLVNIFEMLSYPCMGVKTVNHIKKFCKFRGLLGEIGCASSTEYHYIYIALMLSRLADIIYLSSL